MDPEQEFRFFFLFTTEWWYLYSRLWKFSKLFEYAKFIPMSQQALFGVDVINSLTIVNKNGTNHSRSQQ